MGEMPERRRFPRYPFQGGAEIFQGGRSIGWGTVSDLGLCGCYLELISPLPVGTEVDLRLSMAGFLFDMRAKVVCATPLVGMAMEFLSRSPEQVKTISQIVEKLTGAPATPAVQLADGPQPAGATIHITPESAPGILAMMLKRINEKGVLTREELVEMVKNQ
jgi:PilZ domain